MRRNLQFFHPLVDATVMRNFDRQMKNCDKGFCKSRKLSKWKMIDKLQNQKSKNGIIRKVKRAPYLFRRICTLFFDSVR